MAVTKVYIDLTTPGSPVVGHAADDVNEMLVMFPDGYSGATAYPWVFECFGAGASAAYYDDELPAGGGGSHGPTVANWYAANGYVFVVGCQGSHTGWANDASMALMKTSFDYAVANYSLEAVPLISGQSMGGCVALNFLKHYPEVTFLAAALLMPVSNLAAMHTPLAGNGNYNFAINTRYACTDGTYAAATAGHDPALDYAFYAALGIKFQIWHGTSDVTVNPNQSDAFRDGVNALAGETLVSITPVTGADHSSMAMPAAYVAGIAAFIASLSEPPEPPVVGPHTFLVDMRARTYGSVLLVDMRARTYGSVLLVDMWAERSDLAPGVGELLRIYKHGSATYNEIDSATRGGFSDLVRTQVHNGAGSLTFTLTATTPSIFGAWIDEAATVEYWVNGTLVETYTVDDFTPHWSALSCNVACVGILAVGVGPGVVYSGPYNEINVVAKTTIADVMRDVVQSGTLASDYSYRYPAWAWDNTKGYAAIGILASDDFRYDDHKAHQSESDLFWRTEDPVVSPWHDGAGGASPKIEFGFIHAEMTGVTDWIAYRDDFTARADMYVHGALSESLGTDSRADLIARYVSSTSYYTCHFGSDAVAFYYRSGASFVQIGTNVSITGPVAGDLLGFSVIGTALTAYINGVQVAAQTDGNVTAAGHAGVRGQGLSGTQDVGFNCFTVTDGRIPALFLRDPFGGAAAFVGGAPRTDILTELATAAGYTFWFDADGELNIEPYRTAVDKTYTINDTLHDFDTTYSASGVVNSLEIDDGDAVSWIFDDIASIDAYGLHHQSVTLSGTSYVFAAAYAAAYFAQYAQPRKSARLFVYHDPTLRPGLLVEVTGLGDGRTYQDLIQQITYTLGDLWDEIVTGTPALALKA